MPLSRTSSPRVEVGVTFMVPLAIGRHVLQFENHRDMVEDRAGAVLTQTSQLYIVGWIRTFQAVLIPDWFTSTMSPCRTPELSVNADARAYRLSLLDHTINVY